MNPDDFEQALRRDMAAVPRHDPTPAWKAEILNRALAKPKARARVITFPRFVLGTWAACWAASLVLGMLTPRNEGGPATHPGAVSSAAVDADWQAAEKRRRAMLLLLASN